MANTGHKRDTNARFIPSITSLGSARIAAPVAALATLAVVSIGVAGASPDGKDVVAKEAPPVSTTQVVAQERKRQVSRSGGRSANRGQDVEVEQVRHSATYAARAEAAATRKAVAGADTKLWAIEDLNLWDGPTDEAKNTGLLESGKSVLATGRERNGRTEVVVSDKSRWVTTDFLVDEEPEPEPEPEPEAETESGSTTAKRSAPATGTDGTCNNGSSVSGSPNVIEVHRAVCAQFPSITNYGTYRGDGEHSQGRAIDIMVSGATGWDVAEYVRANAGSLGVEYVIFSQKIWSVDRSGEGWRPMEDRGSATANHYDHVHVTTY